MSPSIPRRTLAKSPDKMDQSTIVTLLAALLLWSLAGAVWFQKRRPHFEAEPGAARWTVAKAGPIVWLMFLFNKLRR